VVKPHKGIACKLSAWEPLVSIKEYTEYRDDQLAVHGTHVHVEFIRFKMSKCSFVALVPSDLINCSSEPQKKHSCCWCCVAGVLKVSALSFLMPPIIIDAPVRAANRPRAISEVN
jgi:hypothetical protein